MTFHPSSSGRLQADGHELGSFSEHDKKRETVPCIFFSLKRVALHVLYMFTIFIIFNVLSFFFFLIIIVNKIIGKKEILLKSNNSLTVKTKKVRILCL